MSVYIISVSIAILIVINIILKTKHPIIKSMTCTLSGLASLACVQALSAFTQITIPLNIITVSFSALLGVPGVGTLTILNSLFGNASV